MLLQLDGIPIMRLWRPRRAFCRFSTNRSWKASSPTTTVYLMGSIHVGDKSLYPLPEAVESAFAAARVLAVEINVKNVEQSKAVKLVQQYGMYSGEDSLLKHIPKETADALASFCEKNGFPIVAAEKMKPWLAAFTVIVFTIQKSGQDPMLGIDRHFLDEVKAPQRIEEFETAEYQISIFASATEEEQLGLLYEALKKAPQSQERLKQLQDAYMGGDPEAISKLVREEETGPKSLMKKLIDDRNVAMTEKVDAYLKGKEPCFVVVGAGHIVGGGLVRQFEQALGNLLAALRAAGGAPGDLVSLTLYAVDLAEYRAQMEKNPDDPRGWMMLARSYYVLQRMTEAVAAYAKAADKIKDDYAKRIAGD